MDGVLEADQASPSLRLVNGVFTGGGAKSIASAGALHAVRDRGVWFGSVAGTVSELILRSIRRIGSHHAH